MSSPAVSDLKASSLGPGVNLDQFIGCRTRLSITPTPVIRQPAGVYFYKSHKLYLRLFTEKLTALEECRACTDGVFRRG